MARYLALAPAFVPRSYLLRVLGVLMLLAGGLLPYFLLEIGDGKHPPDWFSQYMAVTVLFGTASSGGAVLRRIRSWTPSILVTGMWRDVCLLIGAGLVLLWSIYLAGMVVMGRLGTVAPTVGLAGAMLALMASAGVHRKVTFSVIALGTASAIVPHSRAVVFAALQTQTATWLLLLVAVAAFVALLREGATPPGDKDLRFARNIQADLFSRAHISRAQRMTWLPLKRMTGPAAFDAAFEHSPLQAWLNDSIIVLLALGMGVMTFVIGAREPAQVALIVSAMSALLATILPMVTRGITLNISDFLWLCGSHGNKQQLARAMFIRLMRSPLRICVMALVLGQLILGFGPDSNLARLSCSLLLCAPGGAAIILAVAFMLGRQLDAETGSSIAVLSLVMTTTMLVGGIAALAGASLPPITMVVSTSLGSGLVTVIAAIVVSRWLASRRAWIQ